jgi:crotonobetainyl-CoA:carnitine CoA-transferase CaiB-like acyl-CoA transferase
MTYNRGKKSVAPGLHQPEGQAIVHKLLAGARRDVEKL